MSVDQFEELFDKIGISDKVMNRLEIKNFLFHLTMAISNAVIVNVIFLLHIVIVNVIFLLNIVNVNVCFLFHIVILTVKALPKVIADSVEADGTISGIIGGTGVQDR